MYNLSENGLVGFYSPFSHHSIKKKISKKRKSLYSYVVFVVFRKLESTNVFVTAMRSLFSQVCAVSLKDFPALSEAFFFL